MPSLGSMTLDEDDVKSAQSWLKRPLDWTSLDEIVEYERQFAKFNGSRYAYSFNGGRVALSACIHALGLKAGDEVILPGYTCVVVLNAFRYAGVETVYGDIELEAYGLDVQSFADRITPRTRAVLVQHLYGLVCRDYEAIVALARQHGLAVIEDCAQSTGAEFRGRKVGYLGDVAFYSSEQSKVFTTIQGGMAVTNDDDLGNRIAEYQAQAPFPDQGFTTKLLHSVPLNYYRFKHPQRWWRGELALLRYGQYIMPSTTREEEDHVRPAHYGRRMSAPLAALGSIQLAKLDRYNELRRRAAQRWNEWCETTGYQKPLVVDGSTPVYLRFPVLVEPEKKQDTSWSVKELGVRAGVWFVSNTHPAQQPVQGCPRANEAVRRCINLPTLMG